MNQSCCTYEPDLAAAALHALEPIDENAMLEHVARCSCCDRVLAELETGAAVLGAAVIQVAPPGTLERRVLLAAARGREPSTQEISR